MYASIQGLWPRQWVATLVILIMMEAMLVHGELILLKLWYTGTYRHC